MSFFFLFTNVQHTSYRSLFQDEDPLGHQNAAGVRAAHVHDHNPAVRHDQAGQKVADVRGGRADLPGAGTLPAGHPLEASALGDEPEAVQVRGLQRDVLP